MATLLDKEAIRDIEREANMAIISDDDGDCGAITIQRSRPNAADIYGKSYFCLPHIIKPRDKDILESIINDKILDSAFPKVEFEIDDKLAGRFCSELIDTTAEGVRAYALYMVTLINEWNVLTEKYGEIAISKDNKRERELSRLIS